MKTFPDFVFVLLTLLVSNLDSKEFCESFKDNGYEIDFAFQVWPSQGTARFYIGSAYWPFQANDMFDPNQSFSDDFIPKNRNEYKLIFPLKFQSDQNISVGMWRKADNKIIWKSHIPADDENDLNITNFEPTFLFIYEISGCFGQQIPEGQPSKEFRRTYECFNFARYDSLEIVAYNISLGVINWINNQTNDGTKVETLRNIVGQHKIIGIFPFVNTSKVINGEYEIKIVIVYQIDQMIVYCWTETHLFIFECPNIVLLIDCQTSESDSENDFTTNYSYSEAEETEAMTTPNSGESKVLFYVAMGIIAVIVVIFVVGVIIIIILLWLKEKKCRTIRPTQMRAFKKSQLKDDPPPSHEKKEPAQTKTSPDPNTEKKSVGSVKFEVQDDVDYTKPIPLNPNNDSSSGEDLLKV